MPVPRGEVAFTPQEAADIAKRLGSTVAVVKAQIHAGGRGKGGGVKVAKASDEAEEIAREAILGMQLVTYQTGPDRPAGRRGCWSRKASPSSASCTSASLRRSLHAAHVLMASAEGGMDIEKVAAKHPEKIHKVFIDPAIGLRRSRRSGSAFAIGLEGDQVKKGDEDDAGALQGVHRHRCVDCSRSTR